MKKMRIGEFAKQMQVSVRTLQYYDQINLLKPSDYSERGRRLYTAKESFMLYQIKALKQLGFSLEQIQHQLLENKDIDNLKKLLRNQKHVIAIQIESLTSAYDAISKMESEVSNIKDLDYDAYLEILNKMYVNPIGYWILEQMDDTLNQHIRDHFGEKAEDGLRIYATWNELSEQAIGMIDAQVSPQSEQAKKLAKSWWEMVMEFTDGDIGLVKHLEKFNHTKVNWDKKIAKRQAQIDVFIEQALTEYFKSIEEGTEWKR